MLGRPGIAQTFRGGRMRQIEFGRVWCDSMTLTCCKRPLAGCALRTPHRYRHVTKKRYAAVSSCPLCDCGNESSGLCVSRYGSTTSRCAGARRRGPPRRTRRSPIRQGRWVQRRILRCEGFPQDHSGVAIDLIQPRNEALFVKIVKAVGQLKQIFSYCQARLCEILRA